LLGSYRCVAAEVTGLDYTTLIIITNEIYRVDLVSATPPKQVDELG